MKVSLRNLALVSTMFLAGAVMAQDAPFTVENNWWKTQSGTINDYRFGTGWDGKIYQTNKTTGEIEVHTADGVNIINAQGNVAVNLTHDDAGNFLFHRSWAANGDCTGWTIYNPNTGEFTEVAITLPEGLEPARMDNIGRVIGDVLSDEGGILLFTPQNHEKPFIICIANGVQVEPDFTDYAVAESGPIFLDTKTAAYDSTTLGAFSYTFEEVKDMGDDWMSAILIRKRGAMEPYAFIDGEWVATPASPGRRSSEGFDCFVLNDKLYTVLPSGGVNYTTRFAIVDTESGEAVYEVPEELELSAGSQGFGSIVCNKVNDNTVEIYVVGQTNANVGLNYMGMWTVKVEGEEPEVPAAEVTLNGLDVTDVTYNSAKFVVSFTAENVPEGGKVGIEVTDYETRTTKAYDAAESPCTVTLTGLAEKTTYQYMVVGRVYDAEGNIVAGSNIYYPEFTTTAAPLPAAFAYDLKADRGENSIYTVTFMSTEAAASADLVLTNKETGAEVEQVLGEVEKGLNTFTYDASQLEKGAYNWAVRVHSYEIAKDFVTETVNVGGGRSGLATFVDPEFPETFGFVAIGRTQNSGIDVYNPAGELVQSAVHAKCDVLGGTAANTSCPMDAVQRGNEIYLASWGDAAYGVVAYDITTPEVAPYSVFDGTKAGSGLITNAAGEAVGSGTSGVGLWGTGEETTVITFDEDIFANKLAKNVIGTAKTTSNPAELIGNGFGSQLANTNVGIKGVEDGIFVTQVRANGMESVTAGLRYILMPEGISVWVAADEEENYSNFLPSSLASVDVNPAGDLLAISTYDGINVYLLSWEEAEFDDIIGDELVNFDYMKPVLEPYKSIPYPFGRVTARVNVRFDAGNNIHATSQNYGYFKVYLADAEPIAVTPAPSTSTIDDPTGVQNIVLGAEDGEAVYYNVNGIRMQGELPAGVYVKVVGKTATKVVVK